MHITSAILELDLENKKVLKKEYNEKDGVFTKYLAIMNSERTGKTLRCIKMIGKDKIVSFNSTIPFNESDEWIETNEVDFIFEDGKIY